MHNDILTIGKITIHGYGLMIAIGFVVALYIGMWRAKRQKLDANHVFNLALIVFVFGFAGGKLLHLIVNFQAFLENPLKQLGSEGFVVYGGILIGILSGVIYCKVKKLDFLAYYDIVLPSVAVAQGFGRIGCFLAGCCYGKETNAWYGVQFPDTSLAPHGIKVIPTQAISSVGDFLIAAVLILYSRRAKKGNVGNLYLVLYGIGRFVIEIFRNDERGSVGILSTSQFISIFFVVIGVGLMIWNTCKKTEKSVNNY